MPLKNLLSVTTALAMCVGLGWTVAAQEAKQEKKWKDQAEYDIFMAANKAATPKDRLPLLDKWKQQYPQSEYGEEGQDLYLITYRDLGDCRRAFDASLNIFKSRPNHEFGIAVVLGCIYAFTPTPQPADLDAAERVAQRTLANLDAIYSDANKSGIGFVQTKEVTRTLAQRTMGYVPYVKKDWPKAESELTKGLQADATQATLSNWLATALLSQNKEHPEKQPLALYHFARAASYDGPNSLPAAARKQIQDYLARVYRQYHGDDEGFQALLATAKANAFPPADWAGIKDVNKREAERLEAEAKADAENPMKTLWVKILRTPLQAENGESYFETTVKDAALPGGVNGVNKFRGKLVSMTPANRPKELVLAVEKADVPDATLHFDDPLPGNMMPGEDLEFSGAAKSFVKEPFMLTFDVELADLVGWTGKNTPPAKAKPAGKAKPPAGKAKGK